MIAFDLDGTLIDCRARQTALAVHLLRESKGPALDVEAFWSAKRNGATTRDALKAQGIPDEETLATAWAEKVEDPEWLALDLPLDGAFEILAETARLQGARVLTARRDETALRDQLRNLPWPSHVEVTRVSPGRAAEEKARLLTAGSFRAFVGDTESDLKAARMAGVAFLAVTWGQRSASYLREASADAVASTPAEMAAFLRQHGN